MLSEQALFEGMLEKFVEADSDGDGVMTFEEFRGFALSLAHEVTVKKLKMMFREMVEASVSLGGVADSITPKVGVCLCVDDHYVLCVCISLFFSLSLSLFLSLHTYKYTCICIHDVCMFVHTCLCSCVCVCACVCMCLCVCVSVCVCACVCVCVCVCV